MKQDYYLGISEEGFHRVAYTEWGKPNNTDIPIICVHGLTRNGRDFDELASHFSYLGSHLYCPDIVGRGESDWLKNPLHYTFEQYIADMNTLIARTGAKQVDWIGTSLGGLIGMMMASMPKSPIRRLILNDVGAQIPVRGISRLSKYAGRDPDFSTYEEAKEYLQAIHAEVGHLSDKQWDKITRNSIRQVAPNKYITKIDHGIKISPTKSKIAWNMLLHPHKAFEGTLFDVDLWSTWRKITCPSLILHGEYSDILVPSIIQKMQKIHPGTESVTIPGVGHAPSLMDLEQQQLIYDWLMKS